jgi:hypothetical protein
MDNLFYYIVAASVVINWLTKRSQEKAAREAEMEETSRPAVSERAADPQVSRHIETDSSERAPASEARTPLSSWEGELRRLLEGATGGGETAPSQLPAKPPVVRSPTGGAIHRRDADPSRASRTPTVHRQPVLHSNDDTVRQSLQEIEEAQRARKEAEKKLRRARQKVRHVKKTVSKSVFTSGNPKADAVRMIRNPKTVRQAVIASLILNPPESSEEFIRARSF